MLFPCLKIRRTLRLFSNLLIKSLFIFMLYDLVPSSSCSSLGFPCELPRNGGRTSTITAITLLFCFAPLALLALPPTNNVIKINSYAPEMARVLKTYLDLLFNSILQSGLNKCGSCYYDNESHGFEVWY